MKSQSYLFIVLITVSAFFSSCTIGTQSEEAPRKIEVTGSAELEVVPNEISIVFSLREYLDANKQKVKIEDIRNEFLEVCRKVGMADSNVSIASYSGNERWDYYWYKKRKLEPDFMSSISYSVVVNSADKIDQLIAQINEQAIDNFYISNTTHSDIEKLRKEVKTNALVASKEKAEYLAASVGEEVGEALVIQEIDYGAISDQSRVGSYSNTLTMYKSEDTAGGGSDFQKIKLRYEMRVEYRLK